MSETVAASGSPTTLPKLATGTLVAAVGACFVAQFGVSIPAVINGYINQDLHTTSTQLTWVSDAFMVPVTLFELTFGVLGDLFGRKRLLAIGAALMIVGGVLAFFTPAGQPGFVFAGQAISGLGAAAIFPTSVAMIAAGTHTVNDRARAISIWAAALTTGGFMSPVVGGVLAKIHHPNGEFASWRYAFIALAVIALVSVVLTLTLAQNSSAPEGRSLDWPGQITIAVALFALLFGVIQGA
ncbi:MAG: MFS transporter, partial [Nocardioides sp.]|nr:MFS transporter [Nocardioides sp.]